MKSMIIISALIIAFVQTTYAEPFDSARVAPFHMSFVTPLGTNGLESWNTTNNFSINLFAGFSGGLNGAEFAGFANGLKGDMKGVQVAGFCNNTFGEAEGAEIAGFWNYNHRNVKGFQASGFINVAIGYVDGFQASGFTNYSDGTSIGQFSGFANLSTDKVYGVQASGFANMTIGDVKGLQASGFGNIVTGEMKGMQAAGFINYAKKLNGVQVGVVNFADTVESGIPIGVFSFVRDGYLALELGGNESLLGTVSLKTGVKKFYNIISIGGSIRNDRLLWGWGYGIGTTVPVSGKLDMSLEAISYHLNEDSWYSGNINLLNRAVLTVNYNVNPFLSVYAGPALNVWVTNVDSSGDPYTEVPFDRWTLYTHNRHRTEVNIYPGLSAGIRIKMN